MDTIYYERLLNEVYPSFIDQSYPPNAMINSLGYVYIPAKFDYSIEFDLPSNAAVNTSNNFQADSDSDFIITSTQFVFSDTSTPAPVVTAANRLFPQGLFTTLKESGSSRNMSLADIPITSIFGTAERPFQWAAPYRLAPKSNLQASLTSRGAILSAGTDYRLSFIFSGERRYYLGRVKKVNDQPQMVAVDKTFISQG